MANFLNSNSNSNSNGNGNGSRIDTTNLINNLLNNQYERVMILKLFLDSEDENLKYTYVNAANNHNNKIIQSPQHIDAGFDLFAPGNENEELEIYGINTRFFGPGWNDRRPVNKLDFKVSCSAVIVTDRGKRFNTGYYMYPRSSLSKTQLRLANSVGIIDAGYRGHLTGMFDVVNIDDTSDSDNVDNENVQFNRNEADFWGRKFDRYVQICAPGLVPILIEIVDTMEELGEETVRGGGGFGSTGR